MPNTSGPMACPIDGATLVMSERSGIEIDYCPQCRGVWLDRGELDKIIERAAGDAPRAAPAPAPPPSPLPTGYGSPQYQDRGHYGHGHHGRKRPKSFLEELFD